MNGLPEVRRFLKDKGGAGVYKDLKITWKQGSKPVLYLKNDDGTLLEEIALSSMKHSELHYLMKKKGFEERAGEELDEYEAKLKQDEKDAEVERARKKAENYQRLKDMEAAEANKAL